MNKDELLDEILKVLSTVKEDQNKLQKILRFLEDEIYEEPERSDKTEIPEKYKKVVAKIAESIDAGMICFLNPDTLEMEDVIKEMLYDPDEFEIMTGESADSLNLQYRTWEKYFSFEPLDSHESFRIMESFAENMSDTKFRERLVNALSRRKPFANFKYLVDDSEYRQDWFDFKDQWLESHVKEVLVMKVELGEENDFDE